MRSLKRAYRNPVWFIFTLPFQVIYFTLRWAFSGGSRTGHYVVKKSKSGVLKYEHREVAKQILGRALKPSEVVHHINGRKNDNKPSNLCVMSRWDHERYHEWYDFIRTKYGKFPRKETQLRKLREDFRGTLLVEVKRRSI